jgi:hypothetical protein
VSSQADVGVLMGQDFSKSGLCSVFDVVQILAKGFFSSNFSEATN